MYRHILIPTDGSELAERAVTHGLSLAKFLGAKDTLQVSDAPPYQAIIATATERASPFSRRFLPLSLGEPVRPA